MTKKHKTVKELNVEFELLSERVKQLELKDATDNIDNQNVNLKGMEELLKTYDDKIKDLDELLNQAKKVERSNIKNLKNSKKTSEISVYKRSKRKKIQQILQI